MIAHVAPISGIACVGGRYVATAGYDNQVILWDAAGHFSLARSMHDHLANQCEFNSDGTLLASTSSDHTARVWEVPSMKLRAVLADHEDDVEGIAFHPTMPWIATSSRDGRVRVFDLDGRLLRRMLGHTADVISVAWLGEGGELISSSDDGTVKRWNTITGELIANIDLGGVETDSIAVSKGGLIVAGNDRGQLIVLDGTRQRVFDAHEAGIKRLILDRGASRLISLSYDRSAKFWQLADDGSLKMEHQAQLPDVVWPRSGAYLSHDEVVFVTFGSSYARYNCRTDVWDLQAVCDTRGINSACFEEGALYTVGDAGRVQRDGEDAGIMGSLCNFIVPFGENILTGGQMGRVFDARTGEVYYQHRSPLNCFTRFLHKGKPALLIGAYTGEGIIMTIRAGKPVCDAVVQLHENAIKGVAAAGGSLFSVCATGSAAWHDRDSLALIEMCREAHGKIANGCAALPDGRFVSVSRDLRLRIWSGIDPEVLETPHQNSIKCCAASRDGAFIATGDYAGRVGIFSVAQRKYVRSFRPTASGISSLLPSHDGAGFLATSYDGRIYPASTAEPVPEMAMV